MNTRYIIRFISAILFAIVLMVGAHLGLWFYVSGQVEEKVRAKVENLENVDIDLGKSEVSGYPFAVDVAFHGAKLDWVSKASNIEFQYALDELHVKAEMLNWDKFYLEFGRNQTIRALIDDEEYVYSAIMEGGRLVWVHYNGRKETALNINAFTLFDGHEPAVKFGGSYLMHVLENNNPDANWRISMNSLEFGKDYFGGLERIEQLLIDFSVEHGFNGEHVEVVRAFVSDDEEIRMASLEKFLTAMHDNGAHLELNGLRYNKEPFWVTLRGDLRIDEELRPYGLLSVNTNVIDFLMMYLREYHEVEPRSLVLNRYLYRLLHDKKDSVNVNLGFEQGLLTMNGLTVGSVVPIPEMVKKY